MTQQYRDRNRNSGRQRGQDRDQQGRYAPYNPGRGGYWQPDRGWSERDGGEENNWQSAQERSWNERSNWERDADWQNRGGRDNRGWDTRGQDSEYGGDSYGNYGGGNRDYRDYRDSGTSQYESGPRDYFNRDSNSRDWPTRDWSGPVRSNYDDRSWRDRDDSWRATRGNDRNWSDRDNRGSSWQQNAGDTGFDRQFDRDRDWRPLYGQGSGDADYGGRQRSGSSSMSDYGYGSSPSSTGYGQGFGQGGYNQGFGQGAYDRQGGYDQGFGRGGASTWQGRGPKGYQRSDERIKEDISEKLMQNSRIDASDVSVQVQNGKVTLDGTVSDRRMRHAIEDLVDQCIGVKDIDNRVRVQRDEDNQSRKTTSGSSASSLHGSGSTSGSTMGAGAGTSTMGSTTGSSTGKQRDRDNT